MRASRRTACSSDSSTTMPAPSPHTKPSRPASKGREAFSGSSLRVDIAFIEQNPAMVSGTMMASAPPAIMMSASPRSMILKASPIAWLPGAPAMRVGKSVASNLEIGPIPDFPCLSPDQNSSVLLPSGVSAPSPVMTTRRSSIRPPSGIVLDVLDGVADRHDLLGVLVGDLDVEMLLQGHDELDRIEGVGAQVLDELRVRVDVFLVDPELFDDDLLQLLLA